MLITTHQYFGGHCKKSKHFAMEPRNLRSPEGYSKVQRQNVQDFRNDQQINDVRFSTLFITVTFHIECTILVFKISKKAELSYKI